MANTDHRTGISLLELYLSSINWPFAMPEIGAEGEWYSWMVYFIHESKRLPPLRRKLALFRYAANLGCRVVRRKEGLTIELTNLDLKQQDALEYYSEIHQAPHTRVRRQPP